VTTDAKHNFVLDQETYGSADIAEMVCREKSRINQLAAKHGVGTKKTGGRMVFYEFTRADVEWMLNWFSQNGQPRSDEAKSVRDERFSGKDRFHK